MFGRIFLGIILAGTGFMLVWKTAWLVNNFGRIPWFEEHMRVLGGSWMAYKFFGILAIIAGLLLIANLHNQVASAILMPLFGRMMKPNI